MNHGQGEEDRNRKARILSRQGPPPGRRMEEGQRHRARRGSAGTPAERVRQFFSLMELAKAMDWESSTAEELEMVRARWRKLKGGFLSGKKLERAAHGA